MIKYVAFLRGINVGGHKLIKMEELSRIFTSLGCKNVKTYIQSGNVIFETSASDSKALTKKIEKELLDIFGYEATVFLRTMAEVEDMLDQNPFKKFKSSAKVKMYVTFLSRIPDKKPKLPLVSAKDGLEIFSIKNCEAFLLSQMVKGRFGFPNNFIEKEVGVPATTRNWNTVNKIIDL